MSWISRLRPSRTRKPPTRSRLAVEILEDRNLLSTLQVVPAGSADGVTKFGTLSAALAVAQNADVIQIEPGSAPGSGTVIRSGVTIEGAPGSTPSALPQVGNLVVSDGVTNTILSGLNLGTVTFAGSANHTQLTGALVQQVNEIAGASAGGNVLQQNTITGAVDFYGNTSLPAADQIVGNTFTNNAAGMPYLFLQADNGAVVQGNTFTSSGTNAAGVEVYDSQNVQVTNNTIQLGASSIGVVIQSPTGTSSATISGNTIGTAGQGAGILAEKNAASTSTSVVVSGNDLTGNRVGLEVFGDGTRLGITDAGGGGSSPGGNNFSGFQTTAGGRAAILTANATTGTVNALGNVWTAAHPAQAVYATPGTAIQVDAGQDPNVFFVQSLYKTFLHRTGSAAEIQGWANVAASAGTLAVAEDIIHSTEALDYLVNGIYLKYLGRSADPLGEASWVNLLQGGGTEEEVLIGVLSSQEFQNRAELPTTGTPVTPQAAYVEALYQDVLGRSASIGEVSGWAGQFGSLGAAGLASVFVNSVEFRMGQVASYYAWLNRPTAPAQAELLGWVTTGEDLLAIQVQIAGSAEFYANG